jgi:hypothetical protein
LRHYAASQKITVSSPDEVEFLRFTYFLQLHHGPGVYSGSNRNEYHKEKNNVPGSKARLARKTDNLTAIYEPII